jgi:hypothetical protein
MAASSLSDAPRGELNAISAAAVAAGVRSAFARMFAGAEARPARISFALKAQTLTLHARFGPIRRITRSIWCGVTRHGKELRVTDANVPNASLVHLWCTIGARSCRTWTDAR